MLQGLRVFKRRLAVAVRLKYDSTCHVCPTEVNASQDNHHERWYPASHGELSEEENISCDLGTCDIIIIINIIIISSSSIIIVIKIIIIIFIIINIIINIIIIIFIIIISSIIIVIIIIIINIIIIIAMLFSYPFPSSHSSSTVYCLRSEM